LKCTQGLIYHIDHVKLRKPYHGKPHGQPGIGFSLQNHPYCVPSTPKYAIQRNQCDIINSDSEEDDFNNDEKTVEGEDTSSLSGGDESSRYHMVNTREYMLNVQRKNENLKLKSATCPTA
jgi:hypothetical protein